MPILDKKLSRFFLHPILPYALHLLVVCYLLYPQPLASQQIPHTFKIQVDRLLRKRPNTYAEIDKILKKSSKDSILLKYVDKLSKEKEYLSGQAYALNKMGIIYLDILKYPKALGFFQEALNVSTQAENIELKVYSLNMLSDAYSRTEAVKFALDYSQEALELAETVESPSVSLKKSITISLHSIGNIYKLLEQYELAIEKYEKSLTLEKELDNKLGLAINHQKLGECFESQGNLEDALKNFRRSLVYNEIIDSEKGKIICNYNIAHIYVHLKKTNKAIEILEEHLTRAIDLEDPKIITNIYINLGWALIQNGDYTNAKINLEKGLALSKAYNFTEQASEGNKFLYELYVKQDKFEQGLKHLILFKNYEKKIAKSLNIRYVNDMISRYESNLRENQLSRLSKENESVRLRLRKNKTILFIIGIFLALVTGIFYILYRQNQLKAEKKLLTLEQSMLRSQMNPHFLFNSLNSIKLYIINNEQKNAVQYLNKFSKLVRKILEASSQRKITLAEELETVNLYMNIENIRFSNEINFKVEVKDDIDIHHVKIPSLILQPFLENAIWHGLSSKIGTKNIDLKIEKGKKGIIKINITDNGVGRGEAEKIKQGKVLKRKSVGIDITKERLANFSRGFENEFDVEIIDKFDDNNKPIGTQILILIPVI